MATKLITNDELIAGSPLNGNIDVDKYQSVIDETQMFVIEPVLGTKLYDKIIALKDAGTLGSGGNEIYATIVTDYLKPIIIAHVAAEYITISSIMVQNGGVFVYTPENAQPASAKQISLLSNKQRAKADVYIERLQRYLQDKTGGIVEYGTGQDNNYDIKSDKDVDTMGGWRLSRPVRGNTSAEQAIWRDIYYDEGR